VVRGKGERTGGFHNVAIAYNKMHALVQRNGRSEIDYLKVLLSRGAALEPENAKMEVAEVGINFRWDFDRI
jgi:hypothetical protein